MQTVHRVLTLPAVTLFWAAVSPSPAQPAATNAPATPEPPAAAPGGPPKPDFAPHTEVLKDYEQVLSSIDKAPTLLQVWVRRKDNQMLAIFPEKFPEKKFFIAMTVASGERYAGLQAGDMYVYWRRNDKRMVLLISYSSLWQ